MSYMKIQRASRQQGVTFLGVLILVAIIGIVSATTLQLGRSEHRRVAEEALLDVGGEFADALESYRRMTPKGSSAELRSLQDLVKDPRFPGTVRHLRKLYVDPITGSAQWGILRTVDDVGIDGVYSLSNARPIKHANFETRFLDFNGKASYQQWIFTAAQSVASGASANESVPSGSFVSPMSLMDASEPEASAVKSTIMPNASPDAPSKLASPLDLQ